MNMTVETNPMRFLIATILMSTLININMAVSRFDVSNSEQLIQTIKLVLELIDREPKRLNNLYNEILLEPGYYIIPPDEQFFENAYFNLKNRGLMDIQQTRLDIFVNHPWPHTRETIFQGSVKQALKWLKEKLSIGLSLGNEIVYSVITDKELYQALSAAIINGQNTVIKIPNCSKYPCVNNENWLKKIYTLKMPSSDGMRLRISSKFSSLDQEKWKFFRNKIKPFTKGY